MSGDAIVKSFIDRILRLKEEQDALTADIREVYAEAKGNGYDKTAMGEVVAYLRKIEKKGKDAVSERTAMFDLYLDAYERPSHTHAREASQSYAEVKGVDREARSKQRMSESMDDTKALSAEAVALGLIDPEAHAETARIADAVARKYGAGVIAPETGEITDIQEQPETASQSAGNLNSRRSTSTAHVSDESAAPITNPPTPSSSQVLADKTGEVGAPPASSPVAISDDDVPDFLKRAHKPLRPHCLRPELCGGSGRDHCHSCLRARDNATVLA